MIKARLDEKFQKGAAAHSFLVEIGALADNCYREKLKERMNLQKELDVKISQAGTELERIKVLSRRGQLGMCAPL